MNPPLAHPPASGALRPGPRRIPAWAGLVLAAILGLGASAPAGTTPDQQVKAGFIYNFAKFVEWPEAKQGGAADPIVIGVLSPQPIARQISATIKGRRIAGRELVVRVVSTPEEARSLHILFVGSPDQRRFAELAPALRGAGVLIVGETAGFARAEGAIGFVLEGNKVRFEINPAAAERDGLKISSQLLKLAAIVREGRP